MKKIFFYILFLTLSAAAFSQTLPFENRLGQPTQNTNAVISWKASKNSLPKTLWVYRTLCTKFSPEVISNLLSISGFTEKNKEGFAGINQLFFGNTRGDPNLRIFFAEGKIEYQRSENFVAHGPTNLFKNVPGTNQLVQLMTNLLPKLGVHVSEISRTKDNKKPKIAVIVDQLEYFPDHAVITNIHKTGVMFTRLIDGVDLKGPLGLNQIMWGEDGKVVEISMRWPSLERANLFSVATSDSIIKWIHEGRAIYWPQFHMGSEVYTDWNTIKRLTLTKATVRYWGKDGCIRPYLDASGIADTGRDKTEVQISCPIIDEDKPLKSPE